MPTKRPKRPVYHDPPEIAEIRRARKRIWKRAGGTSDGLFRYYLRLQDALKAAGIIVAAGQAPKKAAKRAKGSKKRAA
jgi:hypothetical protein